MRVSLRTIVQPPITHPTGAWQLLQGVTFSVAAFAHFTIGGDNGYVDVRGNRYSVPATLVGRTVAIRIRLDDVLSIYDGDDLST